MIVIGYWVCGQGIMAIDYINIDKALDHYRVRSKDVALW